MVSAILVMPMHRPVAAQVVDSFAEVYAEGKLSGTIVGKAIQTDTYIDWARNLLVTYCCDGPVEATHIMWMDSDMVLPNDVVSRLASHELPIVGGLYHSRRVPYTPIAITWDENDHGQFLELPDNPSGLWQVSAMGLGCCLIEVGVYKKMAEVYQDAWWHKVTSATTGEDIHFFHRCKELDIPVWLDCDVRCGHMREELITTADYERWRRR